MGYTGWENFSLCYGWGFRSYFKLQTLPAFWEGPSGEQASVWSLQGNRWMATDPGRRKHTPHFFCLRGKAYLSTWAELNFSGSRGQTTLSLKCSVCGFNDFGWIPVFRTGATVCACRPCEHRAQAGLGTDTVCAPRPGELLALLAFSLSLPLGVPTPGTVA